MPISHARGWEPRLAFLLVAVVLSVLTACTKTSAQTPAKAASASPVVQTIATVGIGGPPLDSRVLPGRPPSPDDTPGPDDLQLVFQPGSQARYRAREMLLGRTYETDAVGTTDQVEGTVWVRPDGDLVPNGSQITVNLQGLKSDEPERDSYIKDSTLETDTYPEATFIPRKADGLPTKVTVDTGSVSFKLTGDLTIHGVTKSTTWIVNGDVSGDTFTGTATTTIALGDYGMTAPQVPVVLGVEDTIGLELSFAAMRDRE